MHKTIIYDLDNKPSQLEKSELVNFLFEHLDQYGDPKSHIEKAIDYAIQQNNSPGGFTLQLSED